jgi:hypothetical protein
VAQVQQLTGQLDVQRKHIQALLGHAGVTPATPKYEPRPPPPTVAVRYGESGRGAVGSGW